jgi:hypothetical protein
MKDLLTQTNYLISAATVALSSAFGLGYYWGSTPHEVECAAEIVQVEQLTTKSVECSQKLTTCEAREIGGAVIDCQRVCAQQVSKALQDHKDIVCED